MRKPLDQLLLKFLLPMMSVYSTHSAPTPAASIQHFKNYTKTTPENQPFLRCRTRGIAFRHTQGPEYSRGRLTLHFDKPSVLTLSTEAAPLTLS